MGKIKGNKLVLIRQAIYQVLKNNQYNPKTLSYKRKSPYILNEESGTNLAILFQTIQPLRREDKIVNIRDAVMATSNEEAIIRHLQ